MVGCTPSANSQVLALAPAFRPLKGWPAAALQNSAEPSVMRPPVTAAILAGSQAAVVMLLKPYFVGLATMSLKKAWLSM